MSDVDVHETIIDEKSIDNTIDELALENIEPVSNTKTQDKINKNFKEPKEPKTPRSRKPKIIPVSVDNTTFEFDDAANDAPLVPLAPPNLEGPIPPNT